MRKADLFKIVKGHCRDVVPALKNHSFDSGDRLKDLGANSLDRTEIIDLTMDSASLQAPRVDLFGAQTIGELVDILYDISSTS